MQLFPFLTENTPFLKDILTGFTTWTWINECSQTLKKAYYGCSREMHNNADVEHSATFIHAINMEFIIHITQELAALMLIKVTVKRANV